MTQQYHEAAFEFYRSRERHTAYVLSATAAAVALAMTFAENSMPKVSSCLFVFSLMLWAISFAMGICVRWRQIRLFHKTVSIGSNLPKLAKSDKEFIGAYDEAGHHLIKYDRNSDRLHLLQLATLFVGALTFVLSVLTSKESFDWLWILFK